MRILPRERPDWFFLFGINWPMIFGIGLGFVFWYFAVTTLLQLLGFDTR